MRIRNLLDILLLGAMWAPSFLFIKLGVKELAPLTLVASRLTLGGLFLYCIMRLRGYRLPTEWAVWRQLAFQGVFLCSFPFVLFAVGERTVSSALAGMVNGSTPIFAALFAHFTLPNERLTFTRSLGVGLGLCGFLCLVFPNLTTQTVMGHTWGVVAIAIASISYAVGMVLGKKRMLDLPPFVGPTTMLLACAATMIPLAFLAELLFSSSSLTMSAAGSVVGLATFGTAGAYTFFYRVIKHSGAVALSTSVYVMALMAALLGVIFLGETLSWTTYLAAVLIVAGVIVVNRSQSLVTKQAQGLSK